MTTIEAQNKFNIDKKIISRLCKEGYIKGARKEKIWIIPDDTRVIMDKEAIIYVLWQIVNLKNNSGYAVAYKYLSTRENVLNVLEYLFTNGYVSKYNKDVNTIKEMLTSVIITNEGMRLLFDISPHKTSIQMCLIKNFSFINITGVSL